MFGLVWRVGICTGRGFCFSGGGGEWWFGCFLVVMGLSEVFRVFELG